MQKGVAHAPHMGQSVVVPRSHGKEEGARHYEEVSGEPKSPARLGRWLWRSPGRGKDGISVAFSSWSEVMRLYCAYHSINHFYRPKTFRQVRRYNLQPDRNGSNGTR